MTPAAGRKMDDWLEISQLQYMLGILIGRPELAFLLPEHDIPYLKKKPPAILVSASVQVGKSRFRLAPWNLGHVPKAPKWYNSIDKYIINYIYIINDRGMSGTAVLPLFPSMENCRTCNPFNLPGAKNGAFPSYLSLFLLPILFHVDLSSPLSLLPPSSFPCRTLVA